MHELKLRADYKHMKEMKTLQTKFRIYLTPVDRKAEKAFQEHIWVIGSLGHHDIHNTLPWGTYAHISLMKL